jgi:glycosyltransferase involved in cell wall biosynthesis
MKRAGVYSPYWDTLGGGEKYVAALVAVLLDRQYRVDIWWDDSELPDKIEKRFGFDITRARVDKEVMRDVLDGHIVKKKQAMEPYDVIFWVSDGSLPMLFGKKNILHFQVPFHDIGGKTWWNFLKRKMYQHIVCNSKFTKKVIDTEYGMGSEVLYPPATMIEPAPKEQLILSVGRFDNLLHSKRQDALIAAFKQLDIRGWRLVLAGGVLYGEDYVDELRKQADGYEVEIVTNPSWEQLSALYAKAAVFWHAAGYELQINKEPEKAEHFGIATVEAMSAGAVPLVFNAGGQPEIVEQHNNGILWTSLDELVTETSNLVHDNKKLRHLAQAARVRSEQFSGEAFARHVKKLIG